MKNLREDVEAMFAELASSPWETGVRYDRASAERNRAHQAAWRARQPKERLRALKRAEYERNREKRLAYQRAYARNRRALKRSPS